MKKLTLFLAAFTAALNLLAQAPAQYDSLQNIPDKNISALIGQTVRIVEVNELYSSKDRGARIEDTSLVNKVFTFADATRDEDRPQIWVKLTGPETIFYRLTGRNMDNPPFLVNGFFEKQQQLYSGKSFKLKLERDYLELNSGTKQTFTRNDTFTCRKLDLVNHDGEIIPSFILENQSGQSIVVPLKGFETTAGNTIDRFIEL